MLRFTRPICDMHPLGFMTDRRQGYKGYISGFKLFIKTTLQLVDDKTKAITKPHGEFVERSTCCQGCDGLGVYHGEFGTLYLLS